MPVPLGVVAVKRSLGDRLCGKLAAAFEASIEAARANPKAALAFATTHGRGLDKDILRTFIDQYVDDITTDMGNIGVEALTKLYEGAVNKGLLQTMPPLDDLL